MDRFRDFKKQLAQAENIEDGGGLAPTVIQRVAHDRVDARRRSASSRFVAPALEAPKGNTVPVNEHDVPISITRTSDVEKKPDAPKPVALKPESTPKGIEDDKPVSVTGGNPLEPKTDTTVDEEKPLPKDLTEMEVFEPDGADSKVKKVLVSGIDDFDSPLGESVEKPETITSRSDTPKPKDNQSVAKAAMADSRIVKKDKAKTVPLGGEEPKGRVEGEQPSKERRGIGSPGASSGGVDRIRDIKNGLLATKPDTMVAGSITIDQPKEAAKEASSPDQSSENKQEKLTEAVQDKTVASVKPPKKKGWLGRLFSKDEKKRQEVAKIAEVTNSKKLKKMGWLRRLFFEDEEKRKKVDPPSPHIVPDYNKDMTGKGEDAVAVFASNKEKVNQSEHTDIHKTAMKIRNSGGEGLISSEDLRVLSMPPIREDRQNEPEQMEARDKAA